MGLYPIKKLIKPGAGGLLAGFPASSAPNAQLKDPASQQDPKMITGLMGGLQYVTIPTDVIRMTFERNITELMLSLRLADKRLWGMLTT
jgi:hypothetical protein